jgi:hypothetical protein
LAATAVLIDSADDDAARAVRTISGIVAARPLSLPMLNLRHSLKLTRLRSLNLAQRPPAGRAGTIMPSPQTVWRECRRVWRGQFYPSASGSFFDGAVARLDGRRVHVYQRPDAERRETGRIRFHDGDPFETSTPFCGGSLLQLAASHFINAPPSTIFGLHVLLAIPAAAD